MKKLLALLLIIVGALILGAGLMSFAMRPRGAVLAIGAGVLCWIVAWRVDRKRVPVVPEGEMPLPPADAPLDIRRKLAMPIALSIFMGAIAAVIAFPILDDGLRLGRQIWPVALLVGAAVGGAIAWTLLRHSPYLRVDASGFTGPGQPTVPWRDIEGVRIFGIAVKGQTNYFLQLRLARADKYADRFSGLARWRLRKQALLHYGLKFIDTDQLVLFEAIARRMTSAHDAPVLTGFNGDSKWLTWVLTHSKFGKQDYEPVWQQRVNALSRAIHGGWSQQDDAEASTLKLKLARAEKKQFDDHFARLDQKLESAVAGQASAADIEALFQSSLPSQVVDSADVKALKDQLALKARKVKRNNFITMGVVGVFLILYVWLKFVR